MHAEDVFGENPGDTLPTGRLHPPLLLILVNFSLSNEGAICVTIVTFRRSAFHLPNE